MTGESTPTPATATNAATLTPPPADSIVTSAEMLAKAFVQPFIDLTFADAYSARQAVKLCVASLLLAGFKRIMVEKAEIAEFNKIINDKDRSGTNINLVAFRSPDNVFELIIFEYTHTRSPSSHSSGHYNNIVRLSYMSRI